MHLARRPLFERVSRDGLHHLGGHQGDIEDAASKENIEDG